MIFGKLSKGLKKFLSENQISGKLLLSEKKMAQEIRKKMGIETLSDDKVSELMRCLRAFLGDMLDIDDQQRRDMSLSLAHGLGRFKIKFSSDKVDTMII